MPPPALLTLTGNLLAERTLEFSEWEPGCTQRARAGSFQVGGKGINVSRMLMRLGVPSTALCFAGGAPGAECEAWLKTRQFDYRVFPTSVPTRSGTVVRGGRHGETTFLGPDAIPDAGALKACAEFLENQPPGSVLAVCGSLPGWATAEFDPLRDALHRWSRRGALIADTYGPPLAWFAHETTAFLRVNRSEFETIFSAAERSHSTPQLLALARARWKTERWAISDGPAPVWYLAEAGEPESLAPPRVTPVSPTGSGDVMLACVLFARFCRGWQWRDAVAWSLPYAAANAAHAGVAEFPLPG